MHGPIAEVYRRIRGNRVIEIKFIDNMDVGLSVIRSRPETRDVQVEDHRAVVELEADDAQVAALLDELIAQKVRIRSFGEKDPTLEDVFMRVTNGLVS
jgi:ABC-2 type transport system ATP-binding protein